jgi:hypothetical protein
LNNPINIDINIGIPTAFKKNLILIIYEYVE